MTLNTGRNIILEKFNDTQQKKMTDDELDQVNAGGIAEILVQKINDIFDIPDEIRYTKNKRSSTGDLDKQDSVSDIR